jgi:hypothetical protein
MKTSNIEIRYTELITQNKYRVETKPVKYQVYSHALQNAS